MIIEIKMPDLKSSSDKAVLCSWRIAVGDSVAAGDVLYEVETDKVVTEIEAGRGMKIVSLDAEEGDEVRVGQILAHAESL